MISSDGIRFTWDSRKARANLTKHGVTFTEAASVFGDPLSRTIPDQEHSLAEDRWHILGESEHRRLLVVTYTERRDSIRIITARRATSDERRDYEEERT
jgi:uncharacterized DUF497 family protein